MRALDRWKQQLEQRAIPESIRAAAPESPFGFPTLPMRRRAERALAQDRTPSTRIALEALPDGGSVLDVGVGTGASSLPLSATASLIVGVDISEPLIEEFQSLGARIGVRTEPVVGTWPEVAGKVKKADVLVCHHVLYNVPDLGPFVEGLSDHARSRVVVELTEEHPVAWMDFLWSRFHGVEFPAGPTSTDAIEALQELGLAVQSEEWGRSPNVGFDRRKEAVAFVRRRLCLGPEHDPEIEEALGDRLIRVKGGWRTGPKSSNLVTIWWDPGGQ